MPNDPVYVYGSALVLLLVAMGLADYLERSETGMSAIQQLRRWWLRGWTWPKKEKPAPFNPPWPHELPGWVTPSEVPPPQETPHP
jgi:hypothetical protein